MLRTTRVLGRVAEFWQMWPRRYVPDLQTGSSSSCCSDYMSFFENGFAAVGFFENTQACAGCHATRCTMTMQHEYTSRASEAL